MLPLSPYAFNHYFGLDVTAYAHAATSPRALTEAKTGVHFKLNQKGRGAVAELVGIEGGVVSGVINLESSGVEASDWRPRHDEPYHEA